MANPNFIPTMSSNEIWRGTYNTRCITDDLDAIEADIAALEEDKADTNHKHSYNDLSDKPTIPEAYTHPESHPASMVTGLATVATTGNYDDLNGKPITPQLLFGVEYLTNEMWNDQPLYTTLINCGNFTRNSAVQTDITCSRIVRYNGRTGDSCLPFIHSTFDNAYSCWVTVANNNGHIKIAMYGGANVGSLPVEVQVWYTKPTEN